MHADDNRKLQLFKVDLSYKGRKAKDKRMKTLNINHVKIILGNITSD